MAKTFKALTLLLCSLFVICSCRKDKQKIWYDECKSEINAVSEAYFKIDALDMTVWRTYTDSTSKYKNSPEIDQALYIYILGKLSAIFNEATNPASDLYDIIFLSRSLFPNSGHIPGSTRKFRLKAYVRPI